MLEKDINDLLQDYKYRKNILEEITLDDIEKWNNMDVNVDWDKITNKPSTFTPSTHTHNFEDLLEKPTTLEGYGITDVYTKDEIQDNTLNKFKAINGKMLVDTGFSLGVKDGDDLISYNYGMTGAPTVKFGLSYDSDMYSYIDSYLGKLDLIASNQIYIRTPYLNLKVPSFRLGGSNGSFSVDVSDNKENNKFYASIPAEFTDIVKAPRINIYSSNNTVLEGALWNSTYNINGEIKDGLHLSHENGKYLALAYKNASTGIYNSYMICDVEGVLRNDSDGDDWGPVRFEQNVFFRHGLKIGGGEDIILAGKGVNTRITALENAISQGTGMVEWNNVLNKPNTFTPSSHKHAIADVTNLQTTLDSKAPKVYENQVLYGSLSSNFRTWLIGSSKVGGFAKPFRKDDDKDSSMPQFGAGIAWGQADTNGMLCVDYINPTAYIAGGNGDKLLWSKQLAWKDDLTSYLPLSGGTITGNINFMNAVLIGRTITGEASNEINHRIVIGGAGDDKMLFDEYGGDFYFRRTKDGTINQMARITSDGIYEGATLLKDKYALIGHSHTNISPLGRKAPMTGRNAINGIYCYSTSGDDSTGSTMPSGYCVVIGFGDGTGGSAEIAISYTGNGMWFRYLRDYQDNWSSWTRLK